MEQNLMLTFSGELEKRLNEIENRHAYLSYLIENRVANEKLLHLEIMHIISQNPDVVDYLPEKLYGFDNKDKCDFWFRMKNGIEYWVEIKTRPTNYGKSGHARAITHGVDGVIADIGRLRKIKSENTKRLMVFAFYPIYEECFQKFNDLHLNKIYKEIGKPPNIPKISVETKDGFFYLYFEEV